MHDDQMKLFVVAALILFGLEIWRRALRDRAPRWVHVLAILLSIEIVIGVLYAEYRLHQAFESLSSTAASEKATLLATAISSAMNSNAFAVAGAVLATIVLAIGTLLARRPPSNAPPRATLRG